MMLRDGASVFPSGYSIRVWSDVTGNELLDTNEYWRSFTRGNDSRNTQPMILVLRNKTLSVNQMNFRPDENPARNGARARTR